MFFKAGFGTGNYVVELEVVGEQASLTIRGGETEQDDEDVTTDRMTTAELLGSLKRMIATVEAAITSAGATPEP